MTSDEARNDRAVEKHDQGHEDVCRYHEICPECCGAGFDRDGIDCPRCDGEGICW